MSERQKPSLTAEVIFALLIAGAVAWYVWDAASASMKLGNLILIAPAAVLALGALIFGLIGVLRRPDEAKTPAREAAPSIGAALLAAVLSKPILYLALFLIYIFSMQKAPFDLMTFLFVGATMIVSRRSTWIETLAVSAISSAVITYGFKALIPYYDFPTIFF